ncbi:MAG: class I SAM-dependent methyltransferase [Bacteroidetes bacterium]|nr:MAG: class I SAM-dependent methyltransferase [Bacteroidota bacterium]
MKHTEAGEFWNNNAEAWTALARAGYDVYRDYVNTPAFLQMLPDIEGLTGIDIGCGEGYNTRLLAGKGATMYAIDIAEKFIEKAREIPSNINFQVASAIDLPFENETFDFATGFMSLMDVPETEQALQEAYRVLKKGGFLQFSITHPCFNTPHRRNKRDEAGKTYAIEVGDYFHHTAGKIDEWSFKTAGEPHLQYPKFKIPIFTKTLSEWINSLLDTGFMIERIAEPRPDDETVAQTPALQDSQVVAYFLHIRCRK